ncbi:MAG: UvrD-helicase domain-containing protein [Clostridia bacterium]|nr:UvrD-helicase domain-containing protein [Clostridia bacterium]
MDAELGRRYLSAKRRLFDKVLSEKLNDKQREAVVTVNGPLLVLAGAGSGKTTVLVNRITHVIRFGNAYLSDRVPDGVTEGDVQAMEAALALPTGVIEAEILPEFIVEPCPPWAMLAITFTNKAAREIKDRLAAALRDPAVSEEIWAGTFHSVCVRILHRYGELVGYRPGFTIYDTDDKKRLLLDVMKRLNIDEKTLPVKTVANEISAAKDKLIPPEKYAAAVGKNDPKRRDVARVYEEYQATLLAYNALDFDDIIMKTVELLENDEEARNYYQTKFRYVSVDEYQDTNPAQFRLTELLSDGYRNVMVVGDDDQSIYRFRGATVENILSFDKTYPDAKVVKLEQNYRSTKNILSAANAVISHNPDRHEKSLWCDKGDGDPIVVHACADQNDEARYITDTIMRQVVRAGRRYRDFAVLYRLNELSRSLESGFAKSGIPYRVLGSQRFYDRKEIRDIVAYLTLTLSDADDQRLRRVVNEPKRKIGASTVDAIAEIANETGLSMMEVMRRSASFPAIAKTSERLTAFTDLIDGLRRAEMKPSTLIGEVFERTGYKAMLEEEGEVAKTRIDSVNEFVSAALEYEERTESPTLVGFLEEVALISDVDKYDENADAVVLMTIHSAKGLEFPEVFLAGAEEGVFPSTQSIFNPTEMNEERRLAYVALTRAKDRLRITHANERMLYGRTVSNPLSRFIADEIPGNLLERESGGRPSVGFGATRQTQRPVPLRPVSPFTPSPASPFSRPAQKKPDRPAGYGVTRFSDGTRVSHALFGAGTVISSREMGGDVLFEVRFDSGVTKKLMGTYAKLKPL